MKNFDEMFEHFVTEALAEDVGFGDYSTLCCVPSDKLGKAVLKIKQSGIVAGIDVAKKIFSLQDGQSVFTQYLQDGDSMNSGDVAFEMQAHIHIILKCERLVLNCMQRMSGIATLTKQFADRLKGYHTKILDTRKTTPNFRLLEKEAVRIGGGINHRFGLYDMIMLKDNHIDYCGGISNAINRAWEYIRENSLDLKIEVETRNMNELREACLTGGGKIFRIMLDNFSPSELQVALKIIDGEFESEASGGINLDNVVAFAETGVDYVSIGSLIHQAQSKDMSLKAVVL